MVDEYVGMSEEEAIVLAKLKGYTTRIMRRDGVYNDTDSSVELFRINFYIENNKVYVGYVG